MPSRIWSLFWILVAVPAVSAQSQQSLDEVISLRREVDSLKAGQRQLQADILLIKNMLLGKQVTADSPPLQDVIVGTAGSASMGSADAKVVIVEFTDYQCPFCGRFATDTFWILVKQYVNTGKVRYVVRNFPLVEAHPLAEKAAEAAECAGDQNKFWEAHERLFRKQQGLSSKPLASELSSLGIDEPLFRECLDSGKSAKKITADIAEATKAGVGATPTFLFGYRDEKDPTRVKAMKMLTGAQPVSSFERILEYLLDPPTGDGGTQ